jgi:hypothetical protein
VLSLLASRVLHEVAAPLFKSIPCTYERLSMFICKRISTTPMHLRPSH